MRERVLVAQSGFLGDVVLTTPLLTALRARLQPESITVLTTPEAEPLLAAHPAIDRVLTDAKRGNGRSPWGLLRQARRLRNERFTLAIAAHKSVRTALLLAAAGIPQRFGFRQSPGWFLYHRTATRDPARHEVERILCLMRLFGVEPDACDRRPHVAFGDAAHGRARDLLRRAGIADGDSMFIVCPGSVWATKRWTSAGYAQLVAELSRNYGRTLICGGPQDAAVAAEVVARSGRVAVNLVGQADLQTFTALVDRARLVVSNDSAPMHVAVARDVPVVAIFCATTPSLGYGPYTHRALVVEAVGLECRPCGRHGGQRCPRGTNACMQLISVATVLAAVDRLLASTDPSHACAD